MADMTQWPNATSPGKTQVIYSYLYQEYSDDDALQAFVASYNTMAQQYVDWFNQVQLPVYTGALVSGALLDWVAAGLYGITRPLLPVGHDTVLGPFNTAPFNTLPFNGRIDIPSNYVATPDDAFKRILTWLFYKGDGHQFDIMWLKRRVMRFLYGVSGADDGADGPGVDQTYRISVTFGPANQVNINIASGSTAITSSALFNGFAFNTIPFNGTEISFVPFPVLAAAGWLKSAIENGVLDLPFQYTFVVTF